MFHGLMKFLGTTLGMNALTGKGVRPEWRLDKA